MSVTPHRQSYCYIIGVTPPIVQSFKPHVGNPRCLSYRYVRIVQSGRYVISVISPV